MEQLSKKTFKDLNDMVIAIADRFFIARKMKAIKEGDYLAEFDIDGYECYTQYLDKVSSAFDSLSETERNLINNEFFYQGYHKWWESIYSKATFYRYKKAAMKKFLGAFYYG